MSAVRQIVLEAMNSSRTAALSGGSIVAVDGLFAALTSRGLLPVCCAAAPGGHAVSTASGLLPVLSAATVLLPKFSAAGGLMSAISASRAARSLAGSGGPCFGSRISVKSLGSGTLIVVGLAGATVCADLSDSYLLSGSKDAVERSQDGLDRHDTSQDWEEELASREGRLQELERQLDEIKTRREDLAQRERKFDEESAKKQAHFDEERKAVDNGKRLLDDDMRKFHQERYEFGGGKKDGKFTIFLKQLGFLFGTPGKIIDLKRKAEDFEVVNQGFVMWSSLYISLLLAGKFGDFFKAGHRSVKEGARELGLGSPGELPTFCPRCGLELPKLKPCSPCAADGGVAKAPAGVAPPSKVVPS